MTDPFKANPQTHASQALQEGQEDGSEEKPLPRESLYQDGRYAHLWKQYRPQNELEAAGKSDNEKLLDVIGAFRDVQASVGRAALENCADEQFNLHDCFRNGGWSARMTMCKAENRSLARCVDMQKKFLKALGYVSMDVRPAEESEEIQMHADRLFHRMLDHEKIVEEAKEKGVEPPPLPPLMDSARKEMAASREREEQRRAVRKGLTLAELPPHVQQRLKKNYLEGLEGEELEIAKAGLDHEIEANAALVVGVHQRWIEDHRARLKRRAEGKERFDDKIFKYFDFREYPEEETPYEAEKRKSA